MNIDRNEFFKETTIRICGSLDIRAALESSFHYIKDIIPVTSLSMVLYDAELNIAHIIASVGDEFERRFGKTVALPPEDVKFRAARWASMPPFEIINRPDLNPEQKNVFQQLGLDINVSMINIRLELEGNRIGVLALMTKGTDRYTAEHAELMQTLNEPFAIAMANALRHQEVSKLKDMLADDNQYLQTRLREIAGEEIVGAEFGLREVMKMMRQVAHLDSPLLLYGETGVGKEVIANAIHYSSPRRKGPFIKVNCGAIPESLMDSELFGHEKGAFTGAIVQKRGRFERADKGTIFLDEVGELPPQVQIRLLNVLQNKEIERVGGTKTIPLDIRIISATHRNLEDMVKAGQFREDLWFRLNVFPIIIPPLRQRKEDIPALVHHFIEQKGMELRMGDRPVLAPGALERLRAYDWPGNVRELQNIVERALIKSRDGVLRFDTLVTPAYNGNTDPAGEGADILTLDEVNALHIKKTLHITRGRINGPGGAADLLRIHPNTLRKRMDKLGIPYKKGR
ncbi:MAG: sigma 54-interacting transcriptional regulator [Deltaproteobacteria bacterium]|nr:sigma 54-interacting transcriptional regulator [Deltaproteobacteria bacterium]